MRRLALVITAALAALAAAAVLAGCGGGGGTSAATEGDSDAGHNAADITFAQIMTKHHREAVDIAKLAAGRAGDPAVKELAAQIEQARAPEIATMAGWLTSWGEPTAPAPGGQGAGQEGTGIPGEMSEAIKAGLTAASGATFDTIFLEMMTRNHEGAIEVARAEQRDGRYEPATRLAADIEASQAPHVATMRRLLDQK